MNIEIFPCSGGMSEGFRRAGIEFDMAIDYDPNACESHEKNLGLRPLQMDVRDFLRMARLGWRSTDGVRLIVADPPCTPWSRAGKRKGLEDERDMLRETAEIIALLRPDFYLIGNVPGLQDSTSWGVVQDVIGGLAKHGYCVADYVSLDAADYGVPQHRVRPFWFGHRKGTPCIRWPAPTHGAPSDHPSLPGMTALEPWVTCRQALQHLPLEELGRPVRMKVREANGKDGGDESRCSAPARALTTQCRAPGHASTVVFNDRHPPATPDAPAGTIGAKDRGQSTVMLADQQSNRMGDIDQPSLTITAKESRSGVGGDRVLAWPWDRPSTTVFSEDRIMPPGHHDGSNLSQPNAIVLSERAAGVLQGFPDGWTFAGETKKARWSQIGMAMPPPLAHAVARAVREAMERAANTEIA